jgi:hypothetical protein
VKPINSHHGQGKYPLVKIAADNDSSQLTSTVASINLSTFRLKLSFKLLFLIFRYLWGILTFIVEGKIIISILNKFSNDYKILLSRQKLAKYKNICSLIFFAHCYNKQILGSYQFGGLVFFLNLRLLGLFPKVDFSAIFRKLKF